ncbi:MAG: Fic family protein [Clostridiales bacterium]
MDNEYKKINLQQNSSEKENNWEIAFGLQTIDNLEPSKYLKELSRENIAGEIDLYNIESLLYSHYKNETVEQKKNREKEADIVATRINLLLQGGSFPLAHTGLQSIHRFLFKDILENPGEFRTYNISKAEPILNGNTVKYANYFTIKDTLVYDFEEEREIRYSRLTKHEVIKRIAEFTARIWQVHPFGEGNTRTTAIFMEQYLNTIGFNVDNTLFKNKSKFFRNALVRGNYADYSNKIELDFKPLYSFFENLLYKSANELSSTQIIVKECFNDNNDVTNHLSTPTQSRDDEEL